MPSILILISSFDNKHSHCLYRIWCICPISNKGKRRMSRGVLKRKQYTNTFEVWKM